MHAPWSLHRVENTTRLVRRHPVLVHRASVHDVQYVRYPSSGDAVDTPLTSRGLSKRQHRFACSNEFDTVGD